MINSRQRVAALASSLTLTATMLAAPVALAQDDDPAATFGEFAAALESLDLEVLPAFFCAEQADALGGLGLNELTTATAGFDFMLDAIKISIDVEQADVLSQSETEAVVDVVATMTVEFDFESIMPLLVEMFESFGASDEEVAQMQAEMMAEVPESDTETLAGQITLVPGETRPWVICSDLDALSSVFMSEDGMSQEDVEEDE